MGPDDLDFSERRRIKNAHCAPDRKALAVDRLPHGLFTKREVARTLPLPDVFEHGAARFGPAVDRRSPRGIEKFPARGSGQRAEGRSEEHTSELQSLMRISYAVFCLKKKTNTYT